MKKVIPLFPVGLGVYQFGEVHRRQDDKLVSDILYERECSEGKVASNYGGWHSDNLLDKYASFEELSVLVGEFAKEYATATGCHSNLKVTSMWANVNESGDYNMNHHHVGNDLAGVYYPGGEYSNSNPVCPGSHGDEGGELTLVSPRYGVNPGLRPREPSAYNLTHYHVKPHRGLLLLFPSFLVHGVIPCKETRLSIAFSLHYYG